jgi:phosphoribosylformimino-5-aminoimidazole carboxamide ribotide isomerase
MFIIPAIDLKDGRCVRLFQGDMNQETVYFEKPLDAARHWRAEGADLIHVVAICRESGLTVELGGGLRSMESVELAFDLGVSRVVIGTAAYDNAEFLRALCKKFPGKIVVGIDARAGKVAVKGWLETTALDAIELAKRCEEDGAARIIYTDISRDGTQAGINIDETLHIARAVKIPIIASGGISTVDDIRNLLPLEKEGVEAVIVGRALYARGVSLKDAIQAAT